MSDLATAIENPPSTPRGVEIILPPYSCPSSEAVPSIRWRVRDGQAVRRGDILLVLVAGNAPNDSTAATASTPNSGLKDGSGAAFDASLASSLDHGGQNLMTSTVKVNMDSGEGLTSDLRQQPTRSNNDGEGGNKHVALPIKGGLIRPRKRPRIRSGSERTTPMARDESQCGGGSSVGRRSFAGLVTVLSGGIVHRGDGVAGTSRTADIGGLGGKGAAERVLKEVRSPADGILCVVAGSEAGCDDGSLAREQIVGFVEKCRHPAVVGGLCAVCGLAPTSGLESSSHTALAPHTDGTSGLGIHPAIAPSAENFWGGSATGAPPSAYLTVNGGFTVSVTPDEARAFSADSSEKLRKVRKLSLVLDLDHTLVHATADSRAGAWASDIPDGLSPEGRGKSRADVRTLILPSTEGCPFPPPKGAGTGIVGPSMRHYVKLRPHLKQFLNEAASRYEISIYTAGTRGYAEGVAEIICRAMVGARRDTESLTKLRMALQSAEERVRWDEAKRRRKQILRGLELHDDKKKIEESQKEAVAETENMSDKTTSEPTAKEKDRESGKDNGERITQNDIVAAKLCQRDLGPDKSLVANEKEKDGKGFVQFEREGVSGKAVATVLDVEGGRATSKEFHIDGEGKGIPEKTTIDRIQWSSCDGNPKKVVKKSGLKSEPGEKSLKNLLGDNDRQKRNRCGIPVTAENNPSTPKRKKARVTFDPDLSLADGEIRKLPKVVSAGAESILLKKSRPPPQKPLGDAGGLQTSSIMDGVKNVVSAATKDDNSTNEDPAIALARTRAELKEAELLEAKALELRRTMFGSRIVSRTDVADLGRDVKSLRRVFPCGGKMAAIVDDREDVWAQGQANDKNYEKAASSPFRRSGEPPENLLLVRPYHWKPFVGFADVNNSAGRDISTMDGKSRTAGMKNGVLVDDEESEAQKERQLLWTGDILQRVHERYYSSELSEQKRRELTVPGILREMRKEVLGDTHRLGVTPKAIAASWKRKKGAHVVISGLVPLHRQTTDLTLARPFVVRYAEDLGATVLSKVTPEITHVVAARDGTDKTLKARQMVPSCAVVRASWLMECFWSLKRRDEAPHLIGSPPVFAPEKKSNDNKHNHDGLGVESAKEGQILLSGSDSSDDDDDFITDFENEIMS